MLTLELCWNGDHFRIGTVAAPVAGAQVISFQRKHPLCSWFASMLVCFAGGIIANLLLGEPIIAPFKDHRALITASIIWYVVKFQRSSCTDHCIHYLVCCQVETHIPTATRTCSFTMSEEFSNFDF